MKQFNIYAHPQGSYEAVKHGWSWTACGFGPVWALGKKMWALGVGSLGVILVIEIVGAVNNEAMEIALLNHVVLTVMAVIFGAYGNTWREKHLASSGFVFKDTVTAVNGESAIERYLKTSATIQRI